MPRFYDPEPGEFRPGRYLERKLSVFSTTRKEPEPNRRSLHVSALAWENYDRFAKDGTVEEFVELATVIEYRFGNWVTRSLSELSEWLQQIPESESGTKPPVALTADPRVPVRFVVAAMDRCKRAEIEKLDLIEGIDLPRRMLRTVRLR